MKLSLNIGTGELNTDIDPMELGPNDYTNAQNFVIRNSKVQSLNSYTLVATPPVNFFAGQIIFVNSSAGLFYLLCGRTKVYAYDGASWGDVSSVSGYAALGTNDELLWNSCKLGNIPIINNIQVFPEYWSPQAIGQVMQPLKFDAINTWSAKGYHTKVVRSHNNFLFALGLTEGGVDLPTTYRWSHPADTNGLPYTWDETDLAAVAGKASVSGGGGAIVDGLTLRDSFCIYSESAINILDYVGGTYIWQRRTLSYTHGLLSASAVVEALGSHYFMSAGDIMVNDGNSIKSLLTQKLRTKFIGQLSTTNAKYSFAVLNQITKEIYFCYPSTGSLVPDKALIYNYDTGKIGFRDIANGATDAAFGPTLSSPSTWSAAVDTWTTIAGPWGTSTQSTINNTLNFTENVASAIYNLESPTIGDALNTIIERTNLSIGGLDTIVSIQRVYPRIRSTGYVLIYIGSQNYLNGPVTYKQPILFNASTDRKIDIRSTGKLHAWRVVSVADTPFTLEGLDIEYTTNGLR
jgi:hypothetical protein